MAGVASAQQPEMEDETMRDASLVMSLNGSRLDSAFASSPGDPMDISPAPPQSSITSTPLKPARSMSPSPRPPARILSPFLVFPRLLIIAL